jgi:hypothetical protein
MIVPLLLSLSVALGKVWIETDCGSDVAPKAELTCVNFLTAKLSTSEVAGLELARVYCPVRVQDVNGLDDTNIENGLTQEYLQNTTNVVNVETTQELGFPLRIICAAETDMELCLATADYHRDIYVDGSNGNVLRGDYIHSPGACSYEISGPDDLIDEKDAIKALAKELQDAGYPSGALIPGPPAEPPSDGTGVTVAIVLVVLVLLGVGGFFAFRALQRRAATRIDTSTGVEGYERKPLDQLQVQEQAPAVPRVQADKKCRALFDYDSENPDDLNFRGGDIITILDDKRDDWWKGMLNGIVGVFPTNYVERLEEGEGADAPVLPPRDNAFGGAPTGGGGGVLQGVRLGLTKEQKRQMEWEREDRAGNDAGDVFDDAY